MATTNKLVVLTTGDPPAAVAAAHGSYAAMVLRALGPAWSGDSLEVDARTASAAALAELTGGEPPGRAVAAVVVTGSSASVTEGAPWMTRAASWLTSLLDLGIPTLGICFGHQLLAHGLGGRVGPNPAGHEIGTRRVRRCGEDPLLGDTPPEFWAHSFHGDTVVTPPAGALVLAASDLDPHQCLRFGDRCYGLQFHPEFDLPVMRSLIAARRELAEAAGLSASELSGKAREAPDARAVLRRFVHLFAARRD
ncbi:MAG: glutamine amidotransferase [Deltaproteobacteria bacterium]|nr:glutamine amidotransferase [Deltaproteobacteria bacterium]MBW2533306.1 glutamine amidotransferase [Deltaproteobacteria bacterium]